MVTKSPFVSRTEDREAQVTAYPTLAMGRGWGSKAGRGPQVPEDALSGGADAQPSLPNIESSSPQILMGMGNTFKNNELTPHPG